MGVDLAPFRKFRGKFSVKIRSPPSDPGVDFAGATKGFLAKSEDFEEFLGKKTLQNASYMKSIKFRGLQQHFEKQDFRRTSTRNGGIR